MKKILQKSFLVFLVVITAIPLKAQTTTTFKIKYDINLLDLPGGTAQLPGGDYVIGAINTSGIFLQGNLTRVDQAGNVVWCRTMSGTSVATIVNDVIVDNSGNIVVAGDNSPGAFVTKVDAAGNNIWATRISLPNGGGQSSSESANKIIQANDGNYVIGGNVTYFWDNIGGVRRDTSVMFVSKVNSTSGAVMWSNVIYVPTANPDESWINGVTEVSDGYVFAGDLTEGAGTLNSDGDYPSDAVIFKVDKNTGALVWTRKLGSAGQSEYFNDVTTTSGDKILACGAANGGAIMMRFDLSGNIEWSHRWTNGLAYEMTEVMETFDGQYAAMGMNSVFSIPFPSFYGTIHKTTTAATPAQTFAKRYTIPGTLGSITLIPEGIKTADNGFLMALMAFGLPDYSIYAVKTDPTGVIAPSGGCAETNFTPSRSSYSPTTSLITPTQYLNYATGGGITITMANITPVTTIDCRTVICSSPPDPTPSANPGTTICQGQSVTLSATGSGAGVTYDWYTVASGGSPFASGTSTVVSPTSTTTYYVEAEDNSNPGCVSNRIPITITVNTLSVAPTSVSAGATTLCQGSSTTLTVNGGSLGTGANWQWFTGSCGGTTVGTGNSISVSPSATTTYFVRANGTCNTTTCASVTINVTPLPASPAVSATGTTICQGQSTTISATSTGSTAINVYTASTGGTNLGSTPLSVSPSTTTTYYVEAVNGSCANAGGRVPITITVNPAPSAPTVSASPSSTICEGQSVSITASGTGASVFNVYSASTGGTLLGTTNYSASPSSTTTYYVEAISVNGCGNLGGRVPILITVNPAPAAPTVSASPSSTICQGESVTITASGTGGVTFNVYDAASAGTLLGATSLSVSPSSTTTYYVEALSGNSCANLGGRVPLTINVNPAPASPTVSASPSSTICAGDQITISATGTGASSFEVYDASTGGSLLGTTNFTANPASTTTYYIEAVSSNGCSNLGGRIPVTITVIPLADPSWSSPGSTCEAAGTINLNTLVSGTNGGAWSGTGVSGNTFDPTGLSGQSVTITYTVGTAPCQQTEDHVINVDQNVSAAWTNPVTVCEASGTINLNTLITGTGGGSFSGTGVSGNIFDPTGLSGAISITYSIGVPPCQDILTQSITVEPDVDPTWTGPGTTCELAGILDLSTLVTGTNGGTFSGTGVTGNNFDPTGLSSQTITITYTVGNGSCSESLDQIISVDASISAAWNTPGTICESDGTIDLNTLVTGTSGGTFSGTGVTGNNFDPTSLSGSIAITYTIGTPPCQDVSTQSITVNSSPADPSVTATDSEICLGESTTIDANGSGSGITYNVYDAATGGNLVGTTSLLVSPSTTTTYFVEAQDANGCVNLSGTIPVTITVNPLPLADAGANTQVCPNENTTLTATGGTTYSWSTGDNTASIVVNPTSDSVFSVTVTDINGCSAADSVIVSVYDPGSISAENDSAQIENISSALIDVAINDSGNVNSITIISGPSNGTYTLSGTEITYTPNSGFIGTDTIIYQVCDQFCTAYCDTAVVIIRVIEEIVVNVPSGFSPNGDGINDEFVITGLEKYPENQLFIYNRWGELVFEAAPYQNNWKGESTAKRKLGGEDVVDGTYFYVLKLSPEIEDLNGFIELRRK